MEKDQNIDIENQNSEEKEPTSSEQNRETE